MTFITLSHLLHANTVLQYIKNEINNFEMLIFLSFILSKPFTLQSLKTAKFIGKIDNQPKMVDPDHAIPFDIRTNEEHENSLCTQEQCLLVDRQHNLSFSHTHSSHFLIIQNEDDTYTIIKDKLCLSEDGVDILLAECSNLNDKFIRKNLVSDEEVVPEKSFDPNDTDIIFNYGIEDTDHIRDTIVKMRKEDENYSLVPVNRHHNSHVHRVGGLADRAYYTYFSYHPSSRHSAYNFHARHHGVPKNWNEEEAGSPFKISDILKN